MFSRIKPYFPTFGTWLVAKLWCTPHTIYQQIGSPRSPLTSLLLDIDCLFKGVLMQKMLPLWCARLIIEKYRAEICRAPDWPKQIGWLAASNQFSAVIVTTIMESRIGDPCVKYVLCILCPHLSIISPIFIFLSLERHQSQNCWDIYYN